MLSQGGRGGGIGSTFFMLFENNIKNVEPRGEGGGRAWPRPGPRRPNILLKKVRNHVVELWGDVRRVAFGSSRVRPCLAEFADSGPTFRTKK